MAKKTKSVIRKTIRINGELIQKRFTNKEDAAEWYAKELRRKKRVEAGMEENIGPQIVTLEEYAKVFMRRRVNDERVVKGTWRSDGQRFNDYIIPLLGDRVLPSIKPAQWAEALDLIQSNPEKVLQIAKSKAPSEHAKTEFQKKLDRGRKSLSNSTRNKIRTLVNTMYNEAIKVDKICLSNPITQLDVKDEGDREDKSSYWETKEECLAYLNAHQELAETSGHYGYWLWATFSIYTGARIGELLALKHKDINLALGRVRISKTYDPNEKKDVSRTKGSRKSKSKGRKRSTRSVFLNASILYVYEKHVQHTAYNALTDHVFMNTRDSKFAKIKNQGNRSTSSGIRKAHLKACELAGVNPIRVHDVRHTFGAQYIMNGGDIYSLSKLLGHSTLWTTEVYGHLSEGYLAREALRLDFGDAKRDATVMPDEKKGRGKNKKKGVSK